MSRLVTDSPRIVVQGITGREASMVVAQMSAYGTLVAAGVTPGKDGAEVDGVRVLRHGGGCPRRHRRASVRRLDRVRSSFAALDAVGEAVEAGIELILVVTENIPLHDAIRLHARAAEATPG